MVQEWDCCWDCTEPQSLKAFQNSLWEVVCEGLKMLAGEVLPCYKPSLMGDCGCTSKDQNADFFKKKAIKVRLMRFQMRIRTVLKTGIETMCVSFWQKFDFSV